MTLEQAVRAGASYVQDALYVSATISVVGTFFCMARSDERESSDADALAVAGLVSAPLWVPLIGAGALVGALFGTDASGRARPPSAPYVPHGATLL